MDWDRDLLALAAALVISVVTAPAGVSGAVFLMPVQLSVLQVPNPAVTPTNLLYNVVSGPGALWRYARRGPLRTPLARTLLLGAVPGMALGAVLRVTLVADPQVFRLAAAAVLVPLGGWLLAGRRSAGTGRSRLSPRAITALALGVGVVGGVYGIGGGSLLGPVLVGTGVAVATVAPATLLCTFVTSLAGALAYALLSLVVEGDVSPDWSLGIAAGVGGLLGGYAGAALQPHLPDALLRRGLGALAIALGVLYAAQALGP